MNNLISIVLPCYNGEKYLSQSIESVIEQSYENWELIIVDDCSTDNSLSIAEKYAKLDSRIKVVHNAKNSKLPKSLNIGFSYAKGDFLTWTSDDNLYKKDALKEMFNFLKEASPHTVMVCCDYDIIDENNKIIFKCVVDTRPEKLIVENKCGACFLYKRSVAEKIGIYEDSCFLVEDYDYWLRLGLEGRIDVLHKNLYFYRIHEKSLSSTRKQEIEKISILESFNLLSSYLEKYPYIKNIDIVKKLILEKQIFDLETNFSEKKVDEINKNNNHKFIYKLYKNAYRRSHNKIYISAVKKLGIMYFVKFYFFIKKISN